MISKYECIFLDRDGTMNLDPGYISSVKDLSSMIIHLKL